MYVYILLLDYDMSLPFRILKCVCMCVGMYECVYLSPDIVYNNKTNVRIVSTTMVFLSTHIQYRSYTYFLTFPVPTAIKSLIYKDD